jgi:hypothetical protein
LRFSISDPAVPPDWAFLEIHPARVGDGGRILAPHPGRPMYAVASLADPAPRAARRRA